MDHDDHPSKDDDDDLPPRRNGLSTGVILLIVFGGLFAALIVCGGVGTILAIPAIQQSREAARREQAKENLRQLGIAMQHYAAEQPALPPEPIPDK